MTVTVVDTSLPDRGTAVRNGRYLAAQVAGAFGQTAGISAGLMASHMTGSSAVAVVATGVLALGAAVSGPILTGIMRRTDRATGLLAGYLAAGCGAVVSLVAAGVDSLVLLLVGTAVLAAGNSAVMLTRYVLADTVPAFERGRAISRSLVATTAGAILGPNLLAPAAGLARPLGLPDAAGLYVVAMLAFGVAALSLPRTSAAVGEPPVGHGNGSRNVGTAQGRLGLLVLATANAAMVSMMGLAAVHLEHDGHSLSAVGLTVSLHVAGMFVPAPLVGRIADRLGPAPVASAGAGLLCLVGVAGAGLADASIAVIAVVLFALGVGWNLQVVTGSVLLTDGLLPEQRPAAEGRGELAMGLAAGLGSVLGASPLTAVGGVRLLSGTVAVLGAAVLTRLTTFTRH